VRSIHSISVRGVISARIGLSARRSTRSIMCRSSVSMAPEVAPSATTAFTSSSVTELSEGSCRPNRRRTSAEELESSQITGAVKRASVARGRETTMAIASGLRSASCFGTSSPMMRLR
jgi:hypothetical protein